MTVTQGTNLTTRCMGQDQRQPGGPMPALQPSEVCVDSRSATRLRWVCNRPLESCELAFELLPGGE